MNSRKLGNAGFSSMTPVANTTSGEGGAQSE
jgi:hypothetical protein